jgi:flagellar basal body rod protein FlgB
LRHPANVEKPAFAAKKCKFCEEVKNCLQQILKTEVDPIAQQHASEPDNTHQENSF